MKQVLFLVRSAPYGTASIPESVRGCLGFATMPLELAYVLMDDAAWALAPGQESTAIGAPPVLGLFAGLADADVQLFVDEQALAERGLSLEGVVPEFAPVSGEQIAALISRAHAVMTY